MGHGATRAGQFAERGGGASPAGRPAGGFRRGDV